MFKNFAGFRLFKWMSGSGLAIILVLWSWLFRFPEYSTFFIYLEEETAFLGGLIFLAFLGVYLAFIPLESFLERLDKFNFFLQRIPRLGTKLQECPTTEKLFEAISQQVLKRLPYSSYGLYSYSEKKSSYRLFDSNSTFPETINTPEVVNKLNQHRTLFVDYDELNAADKKPGFPTPLLAISIAGIEEPGYLLLLKPEEHQTQQTLHRIIGLRYGEELNEALRRLIHNRQEEAVQQQLNEKIQQATAEIKKHREFLSSVLNSLEEGLIVIGAGDRITLANPEVYKIFSFSDKLEGKPLKQLAEILPEEILESRQQASPRIVCKNQKYIEFEWHPVSGSDYTLLLLRDRTRREKLRLKLQLNETMALLGEMAGAVAHELRNPLGGMELYIDLMRRRNESENLEKPINQIHKALRSIQRTTDSLMSFTRSGQVLFQDLDPNRLINTVLEHCQQLLKDEEVEIDNTLPDLPVIKGDFQQLRSVFINLIQNAVEAQKPPRKIVISGHSGEEMISISIRDYGPGISEEKKSDIFRRFFTTKKAGSGLGLALCHRMINVHSGDIYIDETEGRGSTFTVELPFNPEKNSEINK